MDEEELTLWCGNLPSEIDEELLFELFLQIAPLQKVRIPMDNKSGKPVNYAFITFKHSCSVPYAIEILNGTKVFDKHIIVKARNSNQQQLPMKHQQSPQMFDQLAKMGNQMMSGGETHGRNNFKNNGWRNQNNFRDREDKSRPYRQDRNNYRNNRTGHNRYDSNEQYNNYGNNNHGRRRY